MLEQPYVQIFEATGVEMLYYFLQHNLLTDKFILTETEWKEGFVRDHRSTESF